MKTYVLFPTSPGGDPRPLEALAQGAIEVHWYEADKTPEEQLARADVIICGLQAVTKEMIAAAPRLKLIMQFGVGLETVDIPAATAKRVYVANVPAASAPSQAEFAITLILALAKHLHRAMRWTTSSATVPFLGTELKDKVLGIIGLGNSGVELAARAKALGMKVFAVDVRSVANPNCDFIGGVDKLDYVLNNADFVSLHTTLNDKTRGMIDATRLAQMKPTAYLINVARAGIVVKEDLYKVLKEGRIAGAGIDAFWEEPMDPDDPYLALENAIITPHIATATNESRVRVAMQVAKDILSVANGGRPEFCVNL